MVIVSSDSNTTLVSLGRPMKRIGSLELLQQATASSSSKNPQDITIAPLEFERTHLYLPEEEEHEEQDHDDDVDDGYWGEETSVSSQSGSSSDGSFLEQPQLPPEPLYLPRLPEPETCSYQRHRSDSCDSVNSLASSTEPLSVDTCLSYLPCVVERCDQLLASAEAPQLYTASTSPTSHMAPKTPTSTTPRLVYVSQGEVGHAVPLQCDVLVSDRATTCHILALHSTSDAAVPLSTLTHLDATHYNDCLAAIFQQHSEHHQSDEVVSNNNKIHMSIHILGGYHDEHGTSHELSNWLVRQLAHLAHVHQHTMHCTLETAAISSLNHNRLTAKPLGRGLAMSTRTGRVWLAAVPDPQHLGGPDYALRQLRLWCHANNNTNNNSPPRLSVIHTATAACWTREAVHIPPFPPALASLLNVPDHVLLQYTSTSPLCEQDDFCEAVRDTLRLWQDYAKSGNVVIPAQVYKRQGRSNYWRAVS